MAIKLPDPGNGIPEQKTGNDEWTNMKIVRDNFADQTHAASRLVGTEAGNVMEVGAFGLGRGNNFTSLSGDSGSMAAMGTYRIYTNSVFAHPKWSAWGGAYGFSLGGDGSFWGAIIHGRKDSGHKEVYYRSGINQTFEDFRLYHDKNTTIDSNKNIKTSSPVVRVFNNHLDKIHEANELPIKYTRNGEGDYTIEGTTGLRENDWQIVIPEDDHRNQLIAFTLEDDNGTIRLKTYKRIFNMNTFMFEPDLNTPLDIPEGRWVDLHFNDLPQDEVIDEPAI